MAIEGVRLMAEWKMVGWNELAKLEDGTTVQVLGKIVAEWRRRAGKGRRRTRGNRMKDLECHLGRKWSLEKRRSGCAGENGCQAGGKIIDEIAREHDRNFKGKEKKWWCGGWWKRERKSRGTMKRKEGGRRDREMEEGNERRESQSNSSETASEILRDGKSKKSEDRWRSESEGDEIVELLGKHEKKEAKRNRKTRRKRDGQNGRRDTGWRGKATKSWKLSGGMRRKKRKRSRDERTQENRWKRRCRKKEGRQGELRKEWKR